MAALERQAAVPSKPPWVRTHLAGLIACGLGLAAVGVAALLLFGTGDDDVTKIPDYRFTTPLLIATLAAAITSLVRREGAYALPLIGVGLAACAMVLGWALVLAVIAAITTAVILVMSCLM
jgi:hypothetical protein